MAERESPGDSGQARLSARAGWGAYLHGLPPRLGRRLSMVVIAAMIGFAAGFGAVLFRWLIAALQDLAWSTDGSPLEQFEGSSTAMRLLVPAAGGLLVGLIVKYLAPEVKGHGVPEVMNAVARLGGVIRPIVAIAKSLASAICIATGGSVGREGPIVQVGAAIGSSLGQFLQLSTVRLRTCVGCGAAAGIAATFNAPIAAAFFAAEVILGEFGVGAFGSVVISSVSATVVSRTLLGDVPAFEIPTYSVVSPAEMINYALLGLLAGFVAVAFVHVLYFFEELFSRLRRLPDLAKPVIGGLGIGAIGLVLPEVMGVGYDSIDTALHGGLGFKLLVLIVLAKLVATSFTLGSGGSGGVFAPSLFMGAALGGAVGHAARWIAPFPTAEPGAYAVVGMGAMVAAATQAPITAILIIFEMTGDYRVILGLMLSCVVGTLVAQRLRRESIYTIKLVRRGIDIHAGQEVNVLRQLKVHDILRPEVETMPRGASLKQLCQRMVDSPHYEFFVVDDEGGVVGVISVDDLRRALPDLEALGQLAVAEDIMWQPVIFLREDDTLDCAMQQFGKRTFEELPVLPAGDSMIPIGTVQRQDIINAYNKAILKVDLAGSVSSRLGSAASHRTWETVGGFVLAQIEADPTLSGRPLESLHLRHERGIQIILIEKPGESGYTFPDRGTVLSPGDRLIVLGRREDVEALTR